MATRSDYTRKPGVDLSAISAFSDNIYAFSMTILITTLRLPSLSEQTSATELIGALSNDWRFLAIYAVSFLTIGSYWLLHHTIYSYLLKTDRAFIWLNLVLLLAVTFLPFPSALMGKYGRHSDTVFIYGVVISFTYLMINLITWYACANHRLISPELPKKVIRIFQIRVLAPLILAISGTLLALSCVRMAFLFFALMALANSIPWPRILEKGRQF